MPQGNTTKAALQAEFKDCADAMFLDIYLNNNPAIPATLIYIDGLVSGSKISDIVIKPLTLSNILSTLPNEEEIIKYINHGTVYHSSQKVVTGLKDTISGILTGNAALVFEKTKTAILFEIKGFEKRGVSEPVDENVIKGPKGLLYRGQTFYLCQIQQAVSYLRHRRADTHRQV